LNVPVLSIAGSTDTLAPRPAVHDVVALLRRHAPPGASSTGSSPLRRTASRACAVVA